MNRQNIFKNKNLNDNIKMDSNNIFDMDVEKFFEQLEKENNNLCLYRHIDVQLKDGKKIPKGEKNNMTTDQIKNNRGNQNGNTLSLAVKHCPNLYVIDYDTKDTDKCLLKCMLDDDNVASTPTRKGFHYYIKINGCPEYSNQTRVHYKNIDMDLVKKNNIWETKSRKIKGVIKEYEWSYIKDFFNVNKMNIKNSPPVSPTSSDIEEEYADSEGKIEVKDKVINYNPTQLKDFLNSYKEECYEYDTWIQIGMAVHNITGGDNVGLALFVDWSKLQKENFNLKFIKENWNYWNNIQLKVGFPFLKKLYDKYKPAKDKSLENIFLDNLTDIEKGEGIDNGLRCMREEINKRLIYIKQSSNFVVPTTETICNYDEEGNIISRRKKDTYCVKLLKDIKVDFLKEKFVYTFKRSGEVKTLKVDPLKEWLEWIGRNEKEKIEFDPNCKDNPHIYNIWSGYNITAEIAENFDEEEASPILDHINYIWCKNNINDYEYVLNYLAHIIQKPYMKTGVCLALRSKQGGGKGVILKHLEKIIGDNHYSQNSNAEKLFGHFNGLLEAKTLVNLDEAVWGGNKKLEGQIKNQITETKQTIEKKCINQYNINDFCNYIITTNSEWFAGVEEGDRRYFCLELDNNYAGRTTENNESYFQKIRNVSSESFAKVLYNRDISNFNPRKFKKTKLLQEQVERNWNSPKVWYNNVMKDGGFSYKGHFIEWNTVKKIYHKDYNETAEIIGKSISCKIDGKKIKNVVYKKDFIFNCYESFSYDNRKFMNSAFWREIQKNCLDNLYDERRIQINNSRERFIFLPSLEEAREKWNELQEFKYDYEDDSAVWESSEEEDN